MSAEKEKTDIANQIWRVHAAIDTVYGAGFAKENPPTVALFMQALATQAQADEIAAIRELIANGSGGITVGIEK